MKFTPLGPSLFTYSTVCLYVKWPLTIFFLNALDTCILTTFIELLENSLTLESCGHFVLKSKKEKSGSKILWNLFYLEKKPLRNCWNMFWLHGVLDLVESDSAVSMIQRRDLNMGISPRNLNHIWKHFSTWVRGTDGLESREKKQRSKKSWDTVPVTLIVS